MMKALFKKRWFRLWVLFTVLSPLLSFIAGYGYFYLLAFLLPLGQCIALFNIGKKVMSLIWLIHIPFWLYVIGLELEINQMFIAIALNIIFGEILMTILFRKFSAFRWSIFNILAWGVILGGIKISGSDDLQQFIILGLSFSLSAVISGIGIEYPYLNEQKLYSQLP